jgi:hypothetical protein
MAPTAPSFGNDFRLTLITNDPLLAAQADRAGVNRVGVDLESLGKEERQAGHDTRISRHTWGDLSRIAPALRQAALFVRINPIHSGTAREIETALDLGARVLMLPGFRTADEVAAFTGAVRGRAHCILLLELAPAVARIRDILAIRGVDEVMLGLNDLHLQFGVSNPFEILASPVVDMLAAEVMHKGLPVAVGGVGRVDDAGLPIPTDLVYAQYPRLGATGAWLARSFCDSPPAGWTLGEGVSALRKRLNEWAGASTIDRERAREDLARHAARWKRTPASSVPTVA